MVVSNGTDKWHLDQAQHVRIGFYYVITQYAIVNPKPVDGIYNIGEDVGLTGMDGLTGSQKYVK